MHSFVSPPSVFNYQGVFTLAGGTVESTSPPPRAQVLRQHAGLYADKSRSEFQEPHQLLSLMDSDGPPSDKGTEFPIFSIFDHPGSMEVFSFEMVATLMTVR